MALTSRLLGASGVVIVGVVAAAVFGQIPALGAEDHAIVATPASAAQRLVCPGSPVAAGAAGQKASTLSADGSPSRQVGVAGSGRVTTRTLGGGAVKGGSGTRPRLVTAPAADAKHGAIAGAESQAVTTGDAAGLTATACTVPVNIAWIAAGATTTGRTSVLTLANASSVPAQVELDVWTENGPVAAVGPAQLLVGRAQPARGLPRERRPGRCRHGPPRGQHGRPARRRARAARRARAGVRRPRPHRPHLRARDRAGRDRRAHRELLGGRRRLGSDRLRGPPAGAPPPRPGQ